MEPPFSMSTSSCPWRAELDVPPDVILCPQKASDRGILARFMCLCERFPNCLKELWLLRSQSLIVRKNFC